MELKKKILMHVIKAEKIGGTTTVISEIKNSYLKDKFNFIDIVQEDACGFNPIKAVQFVRKYKRLINEQHADAIYICGLLYSGFLMTLAAKLSNVKTIILSIHGSEWDKKNSLARRALFCGIIEPLTVFMADKVFTVCKHALSNVAIKRGGHGNVIGEIYNRMPDMNFDTYSYGDFRNEIGCSNDKILVAVVGRVVYDKGHRFIIDAIKKLNDERFVFVIVGEGEYLESYSTELQEKIYNKTIHLLGVRNDVFRILKDTDIFLFPTLHENHSKAMLEAVGMRCAIICTNVGGNPEIIDDEETGLIIPACDSEAIVASLKRLSNSDLRKQLVDKATEVIPDRFSETKTFGRLEQLFKGEL